MMRICHIIESTSGGSVRAALDLAEGLLAVGEDVSFVYSSTRAVPDVLTRILQNTKLKSLDLPIKTTVGFSDLVSMMRLCRFLWRTGPYDILHAHSSKAGGIARVAGLFFPKMAKVYTPHAFITMGPRSSRIYGLVEWALSLVTDLIITVSAKEKEHAVQTLGINKQKVIVIPNACGVSPYQDNPQNKQSLGFDLDSVVVGFVGRLVEQKNIARWVHVFQTAFNKQPMLRGVIVGNGPEAELCKTMIKELGLEGKIVMLTDHEAASFYPMFDVLLCSSDYEGFPLIFLEALSASVPIISTPVGGTDEAILSGQTGFVAFSFSDDALADSLESFLSMPQAQRLAMKTAARQHSKNFLQDKMVDSVVRQYRSVCKRGE